MVSNIQGTLMEIHQLAPGLMLTMKNLYQPSEVMATFHTCVHKLHQQEHATDSAHDIHIKNPAGSLSDEQRQEITDTFKAFDIDHGALHMEEDMNFVIAYFDVYAVCSQKEVSKSNSS